MVSSLFDILDGSPEPFFQGSIFSNIPQRTKLGYVCLPPLQPIPRSLLGSRYARGIPDERIWVTLERHMDCGVGLCGHCQLGDKFVCKDGPVFSLAELGPAFGIEGL